VLTSPRMLYAALKPSLKFLWGEFSVILSVVVNQVMALGSPATNNLLLPVLLLYSDLILPV